MLLVPVVRRYVILKKTYRDQPNETLEPIATSVSMFGAPCARDLKPDTKKSLLISITTIARSICTVARPM